MENFKLNFTGSDYFGENQFSGIFPSFFMIKLFFSYPLVIHNTTCSIFSSFFSMKIFMDQKEKQKDFHLSSKFSFVFPFSFFGAYCENQYNCEPEIWGFFIFRKPINPSIISLFTWHIFLIFFSFDFRVKNGFSFYWIPMMQKFLPLGLIFAEFSVEN